MEAGDRVGCLASPALSPIPIRLDRRRCGRRLVDPASLVEAVFLLAPFQVVRHVAQLVRPAVLTGNVGIHGVEGVVETFAAVCNDELQVVAEQSSSAEVAQEHLPLRLALRSGQTKVQQPALTENVDRIGTENELPPHCRRLDPQVDAVQKR